MNRNLQKLSQWATDSRLSINVDKTKYMIFGRRNRAEGELLDLYLDDKLLGRVTSYSYLGFCLDESLNFRLHISQLVSSCNQKICWLAKIRKFIDEKISITLYKSIIMSVLLYGCFFYGNATLQEQQKLQKLQNKSLRICCLSDRYTSNLVLHRQANVLPLQLRAKLELYKLMHRVSRKQPDTNDSLINTRAQSAFPIGLVAPKSEKFFRSISYQGPRLWSELPGDIKRLPYDAYCVEIKKKIQVEMNNLVQI